MTSVTLNAAVEAIYARFVANTSLASTAYTFDGEAFEPPASGTWAELRVREGVSDQDTLGRVTNRQFRRPAVVEVLVRSDPDGGRRAGDIVADATRDIFEGTSFSGLKFRGATVRALGKRDEGGRIWFAHLVEAPFDYWEMK